MLVIPSLVVFSAPEAILAVDTMSFGVLGCTLLCCLAALLVGARRQPSEPSTA